MTAFRILGPIEVWATEDRLVLGGQRQLSLLALLLLRANQALSSDSLIDSLWGDQRAGAAKRLQMAIARLRKALDPLERSGRCGLRTVGGGYLLSVDPDELDAEVFCGRVRDGRAALDRDDPVRASELLQEALDLWRGAPLAEVAFEDFAQAEVRRLDELRLLAVEGRIEADLSLARHAELVGELEALGAEHPTRERLAGQLMLALYRCGRQADALNVFHRTRARLSDELGLEPGPELRALQAAILNQDPSLAPSAPPTHKPAELSAARSDTGGVFVGYTRELNTLRDALEHALAGRGAVALLAGEPGAGKSRLADELASLAQLRGARVLWGRCWEDGGAPAYWPWIQSLRAYLRFCEPHRLRTLLGSGAGEVARVLPELHGLLAELPDVEPADSDAARFRLFDAVTAFIYRAAAAEPLVLVLDDLHAADDASLLLLRFLAQSLNHARVLVLGTYRPSDLAADHPLHRTIAELARAASCPHLSLGGLTAEDTSHIVELSAGAAPLPRLSEAIHRAAEGNPLFVTELVRLLAAEDRLHELDPGERLTTPNGITAVIERRASRLSALCRKTLVKAAAVGREFDPAVLIEADGAAADALAPQLDEAVSARLIEPVPGSRTRLRFSHALVRDALYGELTSTERVRLHGAIGEALERLHAHDLDSHLTELAHHYVEAAAGGWAPKAIDYARGAAERAAGALAFEEAARLYAIALDTAETTGGLHERPYAEIVVALGEQLARGGDVGQARPGLPERIRQVERGAHPDLAARATIVRCLMELYESARFDDDGLRQAVASAHARGDASAEARGWWALSWMEGERGRMVAAEQAAQRSLDCAYRASDQALVNQVLPLLSHSLATGPTRVEDAIVRLREHRVQAGTKFTEALILDTLGFVEAMRGRFAEARHAGDEARMMLTDLGSVLDVARCDAWRRCEIELWAGDSEAAERFVRGACDVMESHGAGPLHTTGLSILADVLIVQDRLAEARDLLAKAAVRTMAADIDTHFRQERAYARIELASGRRAAAETHARASLELALTMEVAHMQSDAFLLVAQVLRAAGREVEACEMAAQSLALAESKGHLVYVERAREFLVALNAPSARRTRSRA